MTSWKQPNLLTNPTCVLERLILNPRLGITVTLENIILLCLLRPCPLHQSKPIVHLFPCQNIKKVHKLRICRDKMCREFRKWTSRGPLNLQQDVDDVVIAIFHRDVSVLKREAKICSLQGYEEIVHFPPEGHQLFVKESVDRRGFLSVVVRDGVDIPLRHSLS